MMIAATPTMTRQMRRLIAALWIVLGVFTVTLFVAGIKPRFHELTLPCEHSSCADPFLLEADEIAALESWGIPLGLYSAYLVGLDVLLAVVMLGLSVLIFWQRSHEPIGVITSLVLMMSIATVTQIQAALVQANAAWLPFSALMSLLSLWLAGLLMFSFPNGKLNPRWSWIVMTVFGLWELRILVVNPSAVLSYNDLTPFYGSVDLYIAIGLAAQVYRYLKASTQLERQQTKWVILGFSVGSLSLIPSSLIDGLPQSPAMKLLTLMGVSVVLYIVMLTVPLGFTLAILRYRLWDIDIIIRRTLLYSVITAILVGIYFGSIVLTQSIFVVLTGQQSSLAVVISTLAIAALFTPIRNRLQLFIDRRFYRRKYNAQKTLDQFSMTVRDEIDIDGLEKALLEAVKETVQPESVMLWLQMPSEGRSDG